MTAFYAALEKGNTTAIEALRQAQTALITKDFSAVGEQRGGIVVKFIHDNLPGKVSSSLSHPYYWAPFILIGNGF